MQDTIWITCKTHRVPPPPPPLQHQPPYPVSLAPEGSQKTRLLQSHSLLFQATSFSWTSPGRCCRHSPLLGRRLQPVFPKSPFALIPPRPYPSTKSHPFFLLKNSECSLLSTPGPTLDQPPESSVNLTAPLFHPVPNSTHYPASPF